MNLEEEDINRTKRTLKNKFHRSTTFGIFYVLALNIFVFRVAANIVLDADKDLIKHDAADIEFNSLDEGVTELSDRKLSTKAVTRTIQSDQPADLYTEIKGGEITGERVWRRSKSPYVAREDIVVAYNGRLTIEAGVTVAFAAGTGITIHGVIQAIGEATARITLKSQTHLSQQQPLKDAQTRGIRLVDGPTPLEGRLQLYHKGSWRAVCSNSRNWTIVDYAVVCQQMGFSGGRFWNWVERQAGFMPRLLYEQPSCTGKEHSLQECAWTTRQLGAGACDYHSDMGVQCKPVFAHTLGHWRGLQFDHAPDEQVLDPNNVIYVAQSLSLLRYVDLVHAGIGQNSMARAALEVVGSPPRLEHVVISHAAYTGMNVTRPKDGFTLRNVTVRQSNGIGVFDNSSRGGVLLSDCNIIENSEDGVRYVGHDLRADERNDRASIHDFCTLPTTAGQTYPIALSFTQAFYAGTSKECSKYFFTRPGYRLSVHFDYFVLHHNETLHVEIFDGASAADRPLFEWRARNYTRPQTVTSTRDKLFIKLTGEAHEAISGYFRLTTDLNSASDVRIEKCTIEDNGGRGVAVDGLRSRLHVDHSSISGNGRIAGVHVTSGAGDVNITASQLSFNTGDGLNITYHGGNRNVSRSTLSGNIGYGIAIWLNETTSPERAEYVPSNQTTVLEYSQLSANIEASLRHGNFCAPLWLNISGNIFTKGHADDLLLESCWRHNALPHGGVNLQLQIGHNLFENSKRHSLHFSPALNVRGRIEYNQFVGGRHGAIYIRNDHSPGRTDLEEDAVVALADFFATLPVELLIYSNYFLRQRGGAYVVSLGLSPYSTGGGATGVSAANSQSLLFTRNFVKENEVSEPFGSTSGDGASEGHDGAGRLNPRSRVAAVIVVGSASVTIFRNILQNPASAYEIGSQLSDQSQTINATFNWLGAQDELSIHERLFHRNDRYNLARIEFVPFLLHNSNPGATAIVTISTLVPRFYHDGSPSATTNNSKGGYSGYGGSIGGEVDGQEMVQAGVYTVTKDINIRPGGKLVLQPGVTLQFAPSVGMMVAGKLEARGRRPDDILFTLRREAVMTESVDESDHTVVPVASNESAVIPSGLELSYEETETRNVLRSMEGVPVRLVGGAARYEGRLQIFVNNQWGTVCDYGWTRRDAALVCHQLGYILNPHDWRLHRAELPPGAGISEDVIAANVRCTLQDDDITQCPMERADRGELENGCTHANDVGVRCYEGAWAGLRFSMLAERADLQYVTLEKAGMYDYAINTLRPSLQMDFARHNLENVRIVNGLHDGLGIIYADLYAGTAVNNIRHCEFSGNRGNGISLRQLGLRVHGSVIRDNRGSGISHDPVIASVDQHELGGWFRLPRDYTAFEADYETVLLPGNTNNRHQVDLSAWQSKYIRTEAYFLPESKEDGLIRELVVRCPAGYVVGIQLLNPIAARSSERITIFDSLTPNGRSDIWDVSHDLNRFPMTSSSYGFTLRYSSGANALGGAVLMLSTVSAPVQNIPRRVVGGPVPTLFMRATKMQNNARGLHVRYYNRYMGAENEHFLRKANESIQLIGCEVAHNKHEAVLVEAPVWDVSASQLCEITLHINQSRLSHNGFGVRHIAKDLRSSNNLFHYTLHETTIENSSFGALEVALPYVWQYNENFTHSVFFGNCTWQRNYALDACLQLSGHYAAFNVTGNVLRDNHCARALIAISGMEKRLRIDHNHIEANGIRYVLELAADSLSEIVGEVPALVAYNIIKSNVLYTPNGISTSTGRSEMQTHASLREFTLAQSRLPPSAVVRLAGVQNMRLHRNLISDNEPLAYDLVAGVRSARLHSLFHAEENWWGTVETERIAARIFDFDNWNDHADVLFQPFLIENNFDASISLTPERPFNESIELENWSGGRLHRDVIIRKRSKTYHIRNDITVLPGVTLTIQHGVQLQFEPNVGILVLGTLIAIGYKESPIIMQTRPRSRTGQMRRSARAFEAAETFMSLMRDRVRLCVGSQNCTDAARIGEGFLEYFNHTTLQWVPICDRRFTERNAQVVCRELGYDPIHLYYGHDRRVEFHTNSLTRIWSWVQPLECRGDEGHMSECSERLNGQLYGHRHECRWDDSFVFISCLGSHWEDSENNGEIDEESTMVYWGGVRFANADFEDLPYQQRLRDTTAYGSPLQEKRSRLEFVHIYNAGMLHNQKSPAVQAVFKNPAISAVTIEQAAYHGINLVAPSGTVHLNLVNITDVLGSGISVVSLTGEGRESAESSFTPLRALDLPYKLFSLVDVCDPQKVITVEERLLVYYKYDNRPVSCVKIFQAAYRAKPLGFRLLQAHLFNHSKEYGRADAIRLFDGDIYNVTARFMGSVEVDSGNERSFFRTRSPTLSLQLIASGAPEHHGFIAEVVTVPISTIGQYRDALHNITYSRITKSTRGAILYVSAGEITPTVTLSSNRVENNCRQLYGNFSTCDAALNLDVQNMHSLHFMNNLISKNQGGLQLRADSRGTATSLRGFIHHNLFLRNRNRPALFVEGRQPSPYQEIELYHNYIAQNSAGYADVIRLRQIVSNFTHNYVHSNIGGRIVEVSGFEKVRLPIYQTTSHNGFYRNVASNWMGRATIVAGTAGQQYVDNIFENPENDYEVVTVNNSIFNLDYWNSTLELWRSKIDARYNYWSYNNTISVQSRIRDKSDDPTLLEVLTVPFQMNNQSILDGKCPPGWTLVLDTCFTYIGAPMAFHEAREFCRSENSSMPFIRTDSLTLWAYLQSQMQHLKYPERVWVQDFNYIDRCTTFVFGATEIDNCENQYGFICEIDPKVVIDPLSWRADVFAISIISAFLLAVILLVLVIFCWYAKSKQRHVQRLERRNSIRQSMRSLNSIDPQGSLRRRNFHISSSTGTLTKGLGQDYKKMMMDAGDGSIDSIDKSVLSSEGGASFEGPYSQQCNEYVNHTSLHSSSATGTGITYGAASNFKVATIGSASRMAVSRNKATAAAIVYDEQEKQKDFELAYRNEGFRDNSTINSINTSIGVGGDDTTPIIHQHSASDGDDGASDYYGNASTLPLRICSAGSTGDKSSLPSFLTELKQNLKTQQQPVLADDSNCSFEPVQKVNTSRMQRSNDASHSSSLPYEQKIDNLHFSPPSAMSMTPISLEDNAELYRPLKQFPQVNANNVDVRRPDSYYTAVRSSKSIPVVTVSQANRDRDSNRRPRTVYQQATQEESESDREFLQSATFPHSTYHRSKSEMLLETDFDSGGDTGEHTTLSTLQNNNRSYSQPLETSM